MNPNSPQELIELIPDLIFYKDLNHCYTNCNQAFLNFVNMQKSEVIGKSDSELFSQINADSFKKVDTQILQEQKSLTLEETFTLENGQIYYFQTTKQVLYDENGEKTGLFCIARDITVQKEYELIYKDNQSLLEFIATENSLYTIFNKIIELSEFRNKDTRCSILLLDSSGKHLVDGIAPSLPDFYNQAIDGIEIGEKVGSCGKAAFNKERVIVSNIDTHENWQPFLALTQKANLHACWSQPIISSHNEVLGTFAIYNSSPKEPTEFELKHISSFAHSASVAIEKDKILKILQEKNTLLMNKSRIASIGEMLENVSHHWRQPLSIISTVASGIKLQKEYDMLDKQSLDSALNNILEYTQRLSHTLDDFKKYSLHNNKKEWFNLNSAFEKAIFILESTIQSNKIVIEKNILDIEIHGLENAFIHALVNILKNACEVLNQPTNFIKIDTFVKQQQLHIIIKDNGGGIAQDIIHKVFDPYFTTKHQSFGTGSGLYICKEIIESQMQGNIDVCNTTVVFNKKSYQGAQFTLGLPLD